MNALVAELSFSFALSLAMAERISAFAQGNRVVALHVAQNVAAMGISTLEQLDAALTVETTSVSFSVPQRRIGVLCPCGFAWNPAAVVAEGGEEQFEPCPRCGRSG